MGLPPHYWEHFLGEWRRYAFVARYGHQQIPQLLGRSPSKFELTILMRCLEELREAEAPEWLTGKSTEAD